MSIAMPAPRRSRGLRLGVALGALACAWWFTRSSDEAAPATAAVSAPMSADDASQPRVIAPLRLQADGTWARTPFAAPRRLGDGLLHVRGRVVDELSSEPVGGVAVVFSGARGEAETTAADDGTYDLALAPGAYRAFVRADGYTSTVLADPPRLPIDPTADDVGATFVDRATPIALVRDTAGVDLAVEPSTVVTGRVLDDGGRPVTHAFVRATGLARPVLGGDVAETDADGHYQLVLAIGTYELEASHPDFAPSMDEIDLVSGTAVVSHDVTVARGCIIRGRVLTADGAPAGDGALEDRSDEGFTPVGTIAADGSFRYAIDATGEVALRAWPWKSPPSAPKTFQCAPGARFDAELRIGGDPATLDGTITTADGRPAAGAYIDIMAMSDGAESQQERADASGGWQAFAMPAGDYVVTAHVPGLGAVRREVHVPAHGVALALSGIGAIDGTLAGAPDGAVAMTLSPCSDTEVDEQQLAPRLVPVQDGRFHIDDVPACDVRVTATVDGREIDGEVAVQLGRDTPLALDATPPAVVTIVGRVTDPDGRPATAVDVYASSAAGETLATTDATGAYRLQTQRGATLSVVWGDSGPSAEVPDDASETYVMNFRVASGDSRADEADPDEKSEPSSGDHLPSR